MAQKIFNRFGLRRELNLSDLPDSTAALNNILRTPSMIGTEESFTKNDFPVSGPGSTGPEEKETHKQSVVEKRK